MQSYHFDWETYRDQLKPLIAALAEVPTVELSKKKIDQIIRQHPKVNGEMFSGDMVIQAYRALAGKDGMPELDAARLRALQMKPVRTQSGVTPVTVLTKPFPCPGKCIFCPNDIRMPKSYMSDEPGAQRAERNYFDPYLQTYNRLQALHNIGHSVDKVELIILGGTWSYYPEAYQIWFIKECFRALNEFGKVDSRPEVIAKYADFAAKLARVTDTIPTNDPEHNEALLADQEIDGSQRGKTYNQVISEVYVAPERKAGLDAYQAATWDELTAAQLANETASCRIVGLVIETRPDNISEAEVRRIRRLGCTKTQIGVQSLQDNVLTLNHRGHDVAATKRAFALLRQAGFKIHAHWMANLYGSTVALDKQDFDGLFGPDFCPDELKIYPCSLIESAELMQYYQKGAWQPYAYDELLDVLTHCLVTTPEYCRLTRVIRDIPSTDIVVGNKLTNFRQIAEAELANQAVKIREIRSREVKGQKVTAEEVTLQEYRYSTSVSDEVFLQFVTSDDKLAAFLRLSIPTVPALWSELENAALIREVHVYGQAVGVGVQETGRAQHQGFGTRLLEKAQEIARENNREKVSVISAVGTREYYRSRGFSDGELYQHKAV